jgi:lysophospholipase L1-like esterase
VSAALVAAKLALGPVLLPQARWVRRTALRLPEAAGPREGTVGEGETIKRVLVVGDSSAAGVGVADQAQALALPLAKAVSERAGGAVGWQLVARTGIDSREALELVSHARIARADVAVIALGVNDVTSQTPPQVFVERLSQLVQRIQAPWAVFSGLPPMGLLKAVPQPLRWYLGQCSRLLDSALRDWCAVKGFGYCASDWSSDAALLAEDGYHPGPALYPQWAGRLASVVMEGRPQ